MSPVLSVKFFTYEQAAEQFPGTGITARTVEWWVSTGKLNAYKVGRHPLIKESDLLEFIERGSVVKKREQRAPTAREQRGQTAQRARTKQLRGAAKQKAVRG